MTIRDNSKLNIVNEYKNKNNPKIKHVCNYCKSTWDRSSALEKHLLSHTNIRVYDCKLCKINFKTKSNLYKHCKSKIHLSKVDCSKINLNSNTKLINNTSQANNKTSSNNNNNKKIILLSVSPGCIISVDTLNKSNVAQSSTSLAEASSSSTTATSLVQQKKPQVLNLDSIKSKLFLNQATAVNSNEKTITPSSSSKDLKLKLNDYINDLIVKNEFIKQNMPQLNKPKDMRSYYDGSKHMINAKIIDSTDTNCNKTNHKVLNNSHSAAFSIDGNASSSLNGVHTTFSFNYDKNKASKISNQKASEVFRDFKINNGLIYSISKTSSSNRLNLIHSSYNYGLENEQGLDRCKKDLKNVLHLVPMHKENLNKLIEPIIKDPPKPVYQWGRKVNDLNNNHVKKGKGNGRYECIECGIRTKKPSMLKKHIRSHANLRPYICKQCNISFKTKGNLVKHMKTKAHIKKLSTNLNNEDLNNSIITNENIDSIALKCQEEIEERLIFKDENGDLKKKRKLVDGIEYETEYFESVQDVAKSLLNLSKINCKFNQDIDNSSFCKRAKLSDTVMMYMHQRSVVQ